MDQQFWVDYERSREKREKLEAKKRNQVEEREKQRELEIEMEEEILKGDMKQEEKVTLKKADEL